MSLIDMFAHVQPGEIQPSYLLFYLTVTMHVNHIVVHKPELGIISFLVPGRTLYSHLDAIFPNTKSYGNFLLH